MEKPTIFLLLQLLQSNWFLLGIIVFLSVLVILILMFRHGKNSNQSLSLKEICDEKIVEKAETYDRACNLEDFVVKEDITYVHTNEKID